MHISVGIGNGKTKCRLCGWKVHAGQRIIVMTMFKRTTDVKGYSQATHIHSDSEDCHEHRLSHPINIHRRVEEVRRTSRAFPTPWAVERKRRMQSNNA